METRKVSEVVFRDDLYPRFEANQGLIQRYAYSLAYLPPIKVNQANILVDGFHRWKAHQLQGETEIPVEVVETSSEKELKRLAYQMNSNHGLQLSGDEKRKYATEMIGEMSVKALADVLSVSERVVREWTVAQRKSQEEERDRKIVELYLRAWNTQESIADAFGVVKSTINDVLQKFGNGKNAETEQDFAPPLYGIWSKLTQDTAVDSHFGAFPLWYMQSLLYYHTEPLDIVFDPFAGGGTTVDACKAMFRRYYCTDRIVKPGREKDILAHDITTGLPDGMPKPKLVFLDPPYWKQAEGKYSDSPDDLANMTLSDFYAVFERLFSDVTQRKIERVALVIQPTQYKNGFEFEDHIFEFHRMMAPAYRIESRYILPYSTQQYNAQVVDAAKERKACLALHRDLIVWKRNDPAA